jgi:hypothetical protein
MEGSIRASKKHAKKVGRPRTTGPGEQVVVRLHQPMLDEIDEWRGEMTRAEALRRLARVGLDTSKIKERGNDGSE